MDFLETIKRVSTGFERIENHPLGQMSPEHQEMYIKGLALYTNIDLKITTEDINYLGMFVSSANQSYEKIYEYKEFAEKPDEDEMERIILWLRSSDYIEQFICDMLRKYRHQVPNRREEEMIGEISIMAGYSAVELAWLLTLIIEPDKKHINNYLYSCSDKMMKHLPGILESLGYKNANLIIDKYYSAQRELIDIFDMKRIDISEDDFIKHIRENLKNHLFDSGEVQEVVKIEWNKKALDKKKIKKGDKLFTVRLVEAQSFLDMLIDPGTKSKSANHKFSYTAGNDDSKIMMIFDDDFLSVRESDPDERSSYPVGVLYDHRESAEKVLKWAVQNSYAKKAFAHKRYPQLVRNL